MIKSFENYTANAIQWKKRYADGETATVVVDNCGVTRAMVREAFEAQEAGFEIACFEKSDMGMWQAR